MKTIHLQLSVVLGFHCLLVILLCQTVYTSMADEVGPSSSATGIVVSPTTSSALSAGSVLAMGHPKRSVVWDYFKYDEVTNQSVCQILQCGSDESDMICRCGIPGKFPTNLRNHVKKYHPTQFAEVLAKEENEKKEKELKEKTRRSKSLKVSQQLTLAESLIARAVYNKDSDRYHTV